MCCIRRGLIKVIRFQFGDTTGSTRAEISKNTLAIDPRSGANLGPIDRCDNLIRNVPTYLKYNFSIDSSMTDFLSAASIGALLNRRTSPIPFRSA